MKLTFEALPIENKEIIQKHILELFGRDIGTVSCDYDMYSARFIFGEGSFPAIIRLEEEMPHNTMEDMLSELMWVDDLKNDIGGVCQPIPSLRNRMVERITVGEKTHLVTMSRKANGAVMTGEYWDKSFFYNAGALLGKIHRTSSEQYERGFRYKRKHFDEMPYFDFSCYEGHFPESVQQKAKDVLEKIKSIPRDPRWYGMTLGGFHYGDIFFDWGDLWLFNFDICTYGYYIFDIISMAVISLESQNYAARYPNMTTRERLLGEDGILTQLRAGYTSEYQLPDEQWNMFDDFYRLYISMNLAATIIYNAFQKELMDKYADAILKHLDDDKSPIDWADEINRSFIACLTPEEKIVVETEMPWLIN